MKRTSMWLREADEAAIARIMEVYGLARASDAVRLAIRVVARAERLEPVLGQELLEDGRRAE